jgi:hypothetical protein
MAKCFASVVAPTGVEHNGVYPKSIMSPGTVPLPGGTVAVLSAGLVGSALLNQRLGDEVARGVNEDWAFLSNFDLFQNAITSAVED